MELKLENLYDDGAFYVEQSNWKTWKSFDKDRNALVTSLAQETCVAATRYYLKGKQEGFMEVKTHQGSVDGKL
jgi:hypothetical protein